MSEYLTQAIQRLVPNAQFYMSGDNLVWRDDRKKPNRLEIEAEITYLESPEYEVEKWRKSASLSRRRFKIGEALYQVNGTPLVQLIEALLAGLTEPTKTVATIAYNESSNFDRLDPFVLQFSGALGMSDEETDNFFNYCINEGWNQ